MDVADNNPPNTASVIEIDPIGMVRRRWPLMLFGVVLGLSLAALYFKTTPRTYESRMEILVGQRSSEATNNGTLSGSDASGDAIKEDQLATHIRLFMSRKLLADAVQMGHLDDLESFRVAAEGGVSGIDHIIGHIEVMRGGEGNSRNAMVLRASYIDSNPEAAATVLDAVYASYRSYVESHGRTSTSEAVELIEKARETHEVELATADQQYREFIASVPMLIDGDNVIDFHAERLNKIENELNTVTSSLAESRSRLEVINTYLEDSDSKTSSLRHLSLLSQKEVERLKFFLDMTRDRTDSKEFQAEQPMRQEVARIQYNKLLDLAQRERTLSDAFGSGHPSVHAIQEEIEITKTFILNNTPEPTAVVSPTLNPGEMLTTYVALLGHDIAELEKRKELLTAEAELELGMAKNIEADHLKGLSLKSALERARSRYNQVILRLQELKLSRSYAGFSTDLLAAPMILRAPRWPSLPIIGALGLAAGGLLGLALALAVELLDSTFMGVEDLEKTVGAPTIAHIPRFNLKQIRQDTKADSNVAASVVSHHSPRSPIAELYRVGRTSMMMTNRRNNAKTILMTSPQPSDGKSTTISNLAVMLAQAGKRVILIDADMRRPVISDMFGVKGGPGLSDVLEGRNSRQVIQKTEVENLDVIAAGSSTSEPAELLESTRVSTLLSKLQHHYDFVLIDAPPVLAVADPIILAAHVDAVMLTVRVRKNGRRVVEQAVRALETMSIPLTGVVVNGVDSTAKTYRYGQYSRNKYGYVGKYHETYRASEPTATEEAEKVAAKLRRDQGLALPVESVHRGHSAVTGTAGSASSAARKALETMPTERAG